MLSSISWLQFSIFILLGLAVYYGYGMFVYYGRELRKWVTGRRYLLSGVDTHAESEELIDEPSGDVVNDDQLVVADRSTEQTVALPNGQLKAPLNLSRSRK